MQPNEYPQGPEGATPPPQPQVGVPSVQRIVQPLSSEADILASAAATRTAPGEPIAQSGPGSESIIQPYADDPTSRLITEPISKPQQPQPYSQSVIPALEVSRKKSHMVRNIILIALLAIGAGGYYFFWSAGRVTTADLVKTEVSNTTYLRPKQWQKIDNGVSEGYGNKLSSNGKSSALMLVNRSSTQSVALANMPDSMLDMARQSALNALTDANLEAAFKKGDNGCNTVSNIHKEADTRSVGSTVGIYKLTADCSRNDGSFNINMKGMLGKDGYLRTVGIIAEKSNWERNKEAYQKMLDSVQQKDSSI